MKKTVLLIVIAALILSLTSCITVKKTHEIVSDIKPVNGDETNVGNNLEDDARTMEVVLTLYFPDNDALYLHAEERTVEVHGDELLAATVIEELFKGPQNDNLSPCLDGEKLVNSVSISDGLCTVDFDGDFAVLNSGGSTRETFAIGSIVNSLCALDGIDEVKINIDGNPNAVFGGHFTLEAPFSVQQDLIAK